MILTIRTGLVLYLILHIGYCFSQYDNKVVSKVHQNWDDVNKEWNNIARWNYAYYNEGNGQVEIYQEWDKQTSLWINRKKDSTGYVQERLKSSTRKYKWDEQRAAWIPDRGYDYFYTDLNDIVTTEYTLDSLSGEWAIASTSERRYNEAGYILMMLLIPGDW